LFSYTAINGAIWATVKISGDRLLPENYHLKECWTWRPPGEKPWLVRAIIRFTYWMRHRKDRDASFSLNSRDELPFPFPGSDTASKNAADANDVPRIPTPEPEPFRRVF
jgi:AGZA family xanthine/uracil permease-like MFS transporter